MSTVTAVGGATSSRTGGKPVPSGDALAVWTVFLRVHAGLVDVLEDELLEGAGMSLSWYDVLAQLAAAPGGQLRMQELAAAIVLSKSGLTRLVDRLEGAGYVERVSCPADRRGTFAVLTASGRQALEAARPYHRRGIKEHFADRLSPRQLAAMRSALDAIGAGLRGSASPGADVCVGGDD